MDKDKHRLEPAFDFDSNESSILIHQGQAEIGLAGETYAGDGEVRLDLLPRAHIHFYGDFNDIPESKGIGVAMGAAKISSFSFDGRKIEGFGHPFGGDVLTRSLRIRWSPKTLPIVGVGDESTQMTRVVFHLFNFIDLIGARRSSAQTGGTTHSTEHVELKSDDWNIELRSIFSARENFKALKEEGGYRLTQIGSLQRLDGTAFSGEAAVEALVALGRFLSFAKGCWCEPICAVGFGANGERVWESWNSPRAPWRSPFSWFDPHHAGQLVKVFPKFIEKWSQQNWQKTLKEVIYWYLAANDDTRGIDAGIILTQVALERISFELAVNDRRLLESEGFKKLRASDEFRLLFSSLGIPLDIPVENPELRKLASDGQINWLDAPHALTEIRNSFVHPDHRRHDQYSRAYFEAWNLGLWFLEMSILALCGYSGTYGNRLKQRSVGDVEDVPWKVPPGAAPSCNERET